MPADPFQPVLLPSRAREPQGVLSRGSQELFSPGAAEMMACWAGVPSARSRDVAFLFQLPALPRTPWLPHHSQCGWKGPPWGCQCSDLSGQSDTLVLGKVAKCLSVVPPSASGWLVPLPLLSTGVGGNDSQRRALRKLSSFLRGLTMGTSPHPTGQRAP